MPRSRHVPGDLAMWLFILAELAVFALFFALYGVHRARQQWRRSHHQLYGDVLPRGQDGHLGGIGLHRDGADQRHGLQLLGGCHQRSGTECCVGHSRGHTSDRSRRTDDWYCDAG